MQDKWKWLLKIAVISISLTLTLLVISKIWIDQRPPTINERSVEQLLNLQQKLSSLESNITTLNNRFDEISLALQRKDSTQSTRGVINIPTNKITTFSDYKKKVEVQLRLTNQELRRIRIISDGFDDILKKSPADKFLPAQVASLKSEIDLRLAEMQTQQRNLYDFINTRISDWGNTFQTFSVILTLMSTVIIGLVGYFLYNKI